MSTSTAPRPDIDSSLGSLPTHLGENNRRSAPEQVERPVASHGRAGTPPTWHVLRHFVEMFLSMMVGMAALGALDGLILSAAGSSVSHVRNSTPEVVGLVMAFNMTAGITVWMRYRRHTWAMCAEMACAMFAPAVAAIVLFWCAVIHGGSIATLEMAAMLPAMAAVMLFRRAGYSQPVHKAGNRSS